MEGHQGQNTAEDCVTANDLKLALYRNYVFMASDTPEDYVKANNLNLVANVVHQGYNPGSGTNYTFNSRTPENMYRKQQAA